MSEMSPEVELKLSQNRFYLLLQVIMIYFKQKTSLKVTNALKKILNDKFI